MQDSPAYYQLSMHCKDLGGECAQVAEESEKALTMMSQHVYSKW